MMNSIDQLLVDRGKTHGKFEDHARITQRFKEIISTELLFRDQRGQPVLTDTQRESIDMVCHKIGRIIAGDASFQDHWDDIAGYAKIANGSKL
jgi:hypothetical protein